MAKFTGTVAVTGLNATDNPGPGVPVIRALRRSPDFAGRIIGLAYDAMDPGLFLPGLLDGAMLIPYPSAGRDALFARLAHARRRFGIDVLIPTLDSELPALCDHEDMLATMGIGVFIPTRDQYDLRSKARLFELARDHDVPVPRSEVLTDPSRMYSIRDTFTFPIAVKGVFYGAQICYSADEAVAAFHKQAAEWGLPIIVQEFVAGEELNVAAIGDGEGGLIGAVPMKKLMLTKQGKGWAGVTIADEPLMNLARQVVGAMKWRGPLELEVIRDRAGDYHLLEINPRFPAWVDLSAGAGQNLPLACARLAAGQAVAPLPAYRVGAAFVRASVNQLVDISALEALSVLGERDDAPIARTANAPQERAS